MEGTTLDVALRVAQALTNVGVEYFVGGSVASSLHGEPRATNDIDIVVDWSPSHIVPLTSELGDDFEVDQDMLRSAIEHRSTSLNRQHLLASARDKDRFLRGRQRRVRPHRVLKTTGARTSKRCPTGVREVS